MSNETRIEKLREGIKQILYGLFRYVWLLNIILCIGVGVWLYFFFNRFYYQLVPHFTFMKETIPRISYVSLDQEVFKEVYERYQDKELTSYSVPENLISPFKFRNEP